MRCSLKNKSLTKQKKRGRLLIHIPGAWSYPSEKQVTSTNTVNVCMSYSNFLLRPSFGLFCKQQTLYFTLKNHTATLHSGNQPKHASFTTISQYLIAKVHNNSEIKEYFEEKMYKVIRK